MEKKKKVFISGPMSGIKDFNKPAFDKAEQWLTQAGYSVFNPARMHFDDSWTHEEIMRIDLAALAQCDYILLLDKWYYSKGALQEYHYANAIGIERFPTQCVESPKKESTPKQRIQIETWGDISGENIAFLLLVEKYCNEILAKGGKLTEYAVVEVQIDDTTEHILRMMAFLNENSVYGLNPNKLPGRKQIKLCSNCKSRFSASYEEPCKSCKDKSKWELDEKASKRSCNNCKHYECSLSKEPCLSCGPYSADPHSNWEPKEERPTDWGDDSCEHLLK